MNKIINWCFLLAAVVGHEKALASTNDVLNQENFLKTLKSKKEPFNQFDSASYRKWFQYFLVYAADSPTTTSKSLKKFEQNVCTEAQENQKNACTKIFLHVKNSLKQPQNKLNFENIVFKFSISPKQKASFFEKIVEEQKKLEEQKEIKSTKTEKEPTPQNANAQKNPFSRLFGQKMLAAQNAQSIQTEQKVSTPQNVDAPEKLPSPSLWSKFKQKFSSSSKKP